MDPSRVIEEFCAAWGRGDVDAIVDTFTEDAVYHNIPMAPCEGKEAIRGFVSGLLGANAKYVTFDIRNQVIAGSLVMNERIDTIVMQDQSVELPVCGVFELTADGKIAAWRDYFDMGQFAGS